MSDRLRAAAGAGGVLALTAAWVGAGATTQAFDAPCALVSGRHLTWYGPSLVEARVLLLQQLRG